MIEMKKSVQPIDVSQIKPVMNGGCVAEWQVIVTFDKKQESILHACGGYVFKTEVVNDKTKVEYHFRESVMGRGVEHAMRFREGILAQVSEYNRTHKK